MKLQGKTILITGGGSGIGLEAAQQFLNLGLKVIITGRDVTKLKAAQQQFPALITIQNDVADENAVRDLYAQIEALGGIDILYNNAGVVGKPLNLAQTSNKHTDDASYEIAINYLAVVRLNNTFMQMLQSRAESAIINTTSILSYQPINLAATYSASKVALRFYTTSLRQHLQLAQSHVKIFELAPPAVDTDMADGINAKIISPEKLVKQLIVGLQNNNYEIRVGDSKAMYYLSRFAPKMANAVMNSRKNNHALTLNSQS